MEELEEEEEELAPSEMEVRSSDYQIHPRHPPRDIVYCHPMMTTWQMFYIRYTLLATSSTAL